MSSSNLSTNSNHDNDTKNSKKRPLSSTTSNNSDQSQSKPKAITQDGEMPQKKFYRSRAHCNPLSHNNSFYYPPDPTSIDWSVDHYPNLVPKGSTKPTAVVIPTVLDIGCGFGGLTIALATLLPKETILGLEIRAKVTEYVRLRILACRRDKPGSYENCAVMRTNTMKFMPNLFRKGSLEKIFICFPDPHFKKKNHPRRIVSTNLLSEYAYFLKPKTGRLYTITDVEDLHQWHLDKCRPHPMFRELSSEEMEADACVGAMQTETEEGKKVERAGAKKYFAVWERVGEEGEVWKENTVGAENFWEEGGFGVTFVE